MSFRFAERMLTENGLQGRTWRDALTNHRHMDETASVQRCLRTLRINFFQIHSNNHGVHLQANRWTPKQTWKGRIKKHIRTDATIGRRPTVVVKIFCGYWGLQRHQRRLPPGGDKIMKPQSSREQKSSVMSLTSSARNSVSLISSPPSSDKKSLLTIASWECETYTAKLLEIELVVLQTVKTNIATELHLQTYRLPSETSRYAETVSSHSVKLVKMLRLQMKVHFLNPRNQAPKTDSCHP